MTTIDDARCGDDRPGAVIGCPRRAFGRVVAAALTALALALVLLVPLATAARRQRRRRR